MLDKKSIPEGVEDNSWSHVVFCVLQTYTQKFMLSSLILQNRFIRVKALFSQLHLSIFLGFPRLVIPEHEFIARKPFLGCY